MTDPASSRDWQPEPLLCVAYMDKTGAAMLARSGVEVVTSEPRPAVTRVTHPAA